MAARDTDEVPLIAAAAGIDDAARRACLTGIGGGHFDQSPAAICQLIAEHDPKAAPALIENGAV
jgi:hypothetical protein